MADPIWIDGLWFNLPHDNAPDFVKGSIKINLERFSVWLVANDNLKDEDGNLRFSLKQSRAGKAYAEVDTYKPKKKEENEF